MLTSLDFYLGEYQMVSGKNLLWVIVFLLLGGQCRPGPEGETLYTTTSKSRNKQKIKTGTGKNVLPFASIPFWPKITVPGKERCGRSVLLRYRQQVHYYLGTILVEPLPYGPRIADRPRHIVPVSLAEIAERIESSPRVRGCFTPPNRMTAGDCVLRVALELDGMGKSTRAQVVEGTKKCTRLAKCVSEALKHITLRRVPLRATKAQFYLAFKGGQSPKKRRGRKGIAKDPAPTQGLPSGQCVHVSSRVPVKLKTATIIATISQERKLDNSPQTGTLPHTALRRPFRYNLGAYRACYIRALRVHHGLKGKVVFQGQLTLSGAFKLKVFRSTVGSPKLERCLLNAAEQVRLSPLPDSKRFQLSPRGASIRLAFKLRPKKRILDRSTAKTTPYKVELKAQKALVAKDGALAAHHYAALIKQLPGHNRVCHWKIGLAKAVLLKYPWRGPRFLQAVAFMVQGQKKPVTRNQKICFAAIREFFFQYVPPLDDLKLGMPMGLMATRDWNLFRLIYAINDSERLELIEEIGRIYALNLYNTEAIRIYSRALGFAHDDVTKKRLNAITTKLNSKTVISTKGQPQR